MKKILVSACLALLGSVTLFAQIGAAPQVVHTREKSAIHVPPQENAVALKRIYSNLGTKTDLYNDQNGWAILGPTSSLPGAGLPEFIAMPFTPKLDAKVSQVGVAVQYMSGDDQVNLSIYADSGSGYPGTLLAGPVTVSNLPGSSCCTLTVANFPPVAVSAGTQYWVVADTPATGTGSDFEGKWAWVVKDMGEWAEGTPTYGWYSLPVDGLPAGEVLGTVD